MTSVVYVDPELCIGSGDCARLLPAAFAMDEAQGVAKVLDGATMADPSQLVRAARACPTQAIRVVTDDGTRRPNSDPGIAR